MVRFRSSKTAGAGSSCALCGGSKRVGPIEGLTLATLLVLVGSVSSFYLVGLPLLAVGVGMAVKRDRCVCARA